MHEEILRETVRKGIKLYFKQQDQKIIENLLEETKLRNRLRDVIVEICLNDNMLLEAAVEDTEIDTHDNTGINTLKDMLKNTNVLTTLRQVYKTLTTDENQRNSFRAHVVRWIQDTLAPIKINDKAPEPIEEEGMALHEADDPLADGDVDISVTDDDEPDGEKFIEADDGAPPAEPEEEKDSENSKMDPIEGEDTTGRNKAERIYPAIEKSIINYYGELDNDEDQELFHDYLIANIKLYFDKWEGEMSPNVEEPTNDAYEESGAGGEGEEEAGL